MSKEELQVNFRMPASLKAELEQAAKKNRRSVTAEVVARLEASNAKETSMHELLPASKIREIAAAARRNLYEEVRTEILSEINFAASRGLSSTSVDLGDYQLDSMPEEEKFEVIGHMENDLMAAGYTIDWDGSTLLISF